MIKYLTTVALVLLWAPSATTLTAKPKATGIFGSLQYHKESGDVTGIEVFVVYTKQGHMASVQIAEGVPEAPVLVPVRLIGESLSFDVPDSGKTLKFSATIRPDGLYGRFENGAFSDRSDGRFLLKRGRSYWQ